MVGPTAASKRRKTWSCFGAVRKGKFTNEDFRCFMITWLFEWKRCSWSKWLITFLCVSYSYSNAGCHLCVSYSYSSAGCHACCGIFRDFLWKLGHGHLLRCFHSRVFSQNMMPPGSPKVWELNNPGIFARDSRDIQRSLKSNLTWPIFEPELIGPHDRWLYQIFFVGIGSSDHFRG